MQDEWTYFIQSTEGGPIKIGYTSQDPNERLANLQTGSPVPLRIVGLLRGNREREMHRKFQTNRKHGEWFEPSQELIAFIDSQAESGRADHFRKTTGLKLRGRAVQLRNAATKYVGPGWFDNVIPNDDDVYERLHRAYEWQCQFEGNCDTDDFGDESIDDIDDDVNYRDEISTENDAIDGFLSVIMDEKFFESVCLNIECGWICFLCGPCNSRRRFELLKDLASVAYDLDCITGRWKPFAVFWDGNRQIGIDLVRLHITNGVGNDHIFDPVTLCQEFVIVET